MTEEYHEVDYQYIWHVMETPIQTLVDFSQQTNNIVLMINNIRNHLKDSEEFVHPLIDKEEKEKST